MSRVGKLRLGAVPAMFRQVVISAYHVSPLAIQSHEQITLFSILAQFLWPIFNNEVDHFIRA